MNEFEKACNTENYTGDMTQECVLEWIRGDKEVTATFAGNTRHCNRVKKYAEEYPDEVKIVANNSDGSVVAHLPLSYIKITRPREMSDEQKEVVRERFAKMREDGLL